MPRKPSPTNEELNTEKIVQIPNHYQEDNDAIDNLTRMLASLLNYLSDEGNFLLYTHKKTFSNEKEWH